MPSIWINAVIKLQYSPVFWTLPWKVSIVQTICFWSTVQIQVSTLGVSKFTQVELHAEICDSFCLFWADQEASFAEHKDWKQHSKLIFGLLKIIMASVALLDDYSQSGSWPLEHYVRYNIIYYNEQHLFKPNKPEKGVNSQMSNSSWQSSLGKMLRNRGSQMTESSMDENFTERMLRKVKTPKSNSPTAPLCHCYCSLVLPKSQQFILIVSGFRFLMIRIKKTKTKAHLRTVLALSQRTWRTKLRGAKMLLSNYW